MITNNVETLMKLNTPKLMLTALALAATSAYAAGPVIGLITKTETNPFFVKMKEGAQAEAAKLGAKVMSAAGKTDGDNAGQVTAMENMIAAGAKTILITPSDSKAIVPAIKKAQAQGVMVIALDSPTEPANATDALFATDNYKAGVFIGQYAKAALNGKKPVIATLDLFPGHPVGAQRHNGFLQGYGLTSLDAKSNDPFIPASCLPTQGHVSDQVTLWQPEAGGHVGFASGKFPGDLKEMPWAVTEWMTQHG
jgi:fructose transport system substrate-binding protein